MSIETRRGTPSRLDPDIRRVLDALRAGIRRYVWIDGLAAALAGLVATFWAALAFDWFFEPAPLVRVAILLGAALILGVIVLELIVRRAFVRLSDANLAMLLERRFPELNESLLTTVERRAAAGQDGAVCSAELLVRTAGLAAQRARGLPLRRVFNRRPLQGRIAMAAALAASVLAFGWLAPEEIAVWGRRTFLLADELWPRRARIVVEGFPNGVAKVARGSDLEVLAKADTSWPLIPDVVQIRYRMDGGGRGRVPMVRVGVADPRKDPFQDFNYTFRGLLSAVRFDLVGGDAVVKDLYIEVVESPTVQMSLKWQSPAYMRLPPREMPVTGTMQVPRGSRVTLVGHHANKDLVRVQIDSDHEEGGTPSEVISLEGTERRGFQYEMPCLDKDRSLLITLWDADGIRSRDPMRVVLAASPDEPPRLGVQLRGIGPAITPKARLPVEGPVSDDFGIARAWFEAIVDAQPAVQQPIEIPDRLPTELTLSGALDVEPLGVKAGQRLVASVKAADRCDLTGEPNVGLGERWMLDVVSPEQLRAMLEARELVLRQRFEAVIHEVTETRELLARLKVGPMGGASPPTGNGDDSSPKPSAPEGAEPEDESNAAGDSPQRAVAMGSLRVERGMQNARKNAHETLGIAESFEDIRLQLINNRIDTEELLERLQGGIAQPLRRVGGQMFPELERRLESLRASLGDPAAAEQYRGQAQLQLDRILVVMRQVLQRMLELENFNEAVELLRDIIRQQEQLDQQTKQRHKQKLRDLLKE